MKTFNYTMNHKADEAYMKSMCQKGWAAKSLAEGVWTFEPCTPGQYCYRVGYLRGKSDAEIEAMKQQLAARGIEFVSRYAFWAIFRSEQEFTLYSPEEELALCEKIRAPMVPGSVLSWLAAAVLFVLGLRVSGWCFLPAALAAVYAVVCTCLAVSYAGLIQKLKEESR